MQVIRAGIVRLLGAMGVGRRGSSGLPPGYGPVQRASVTRDPVFWVAVGLVAIFLGGFGLTSASTAFFTFTSWVTGNAFQSGTVALTASRTSSTDLVVDKLLPGDLLTRRLAVTNPAPGVTPQPDTDCTRTTAPAEASGGATPTPRPSVLCTAYYLSIVPKSLDNGTATPVPTLLEHDRDGGVHIAIFRCTTDEAGVTPIACPDTTAASVPVYLHEISGVTGGTTRIMTTGASLQASDLNVVGTSLRFVPGSRINSIAPSGSTGSAAFVATGIFVAGQPILTARNDQCNPEYFDYPTPAGLLRANAAVRTVVVPTPTGAVASATPTATVTPSPGAIPTVPITDACPMGGRRTGLRTAPTIMQSDGVTITIPGGDGVSGLAPGDTDYLLLIAYLPSTASNELQGLSQKYSVNLSAVQPAPESISAPPVRTPFNTRTVTRTPTVTPTGTPGNTRTPTITPTPDSIPPLVQSIVLANSATAVAGPGTTLAFTVTYSEPVFDVGAGDFEVEVGPGVTGMPTISQVIGISNSYKITLNRNGATGNHGVTGNATIGLKVTANAAARDGLGNKVQSTAVASSQTYRLDTTGPTFAVTYSRLSPVNAGALTLTLTSNESLSAPPRISINQPGSTDVTDEVTSVGASSSTFTYAYTVSTNSGSAYVDGTATVSVKGNDIAGNEGTQVTGATFLIDTTAPNAPTAPAFAPGGGTVVAGALNGTNTTLTLTATITAGSVGAAGYAELLLDGAPFSPSIKTTPGYPSNTATQVAISLGTTTNSQLQTLIPAGSHTLSVRLYDSSSPPNVSAASAPIAITVDYTAPTITGVTTTYSGSATAGASIPIVVAFSEPITTTASSTLAMNVTPTARNATCPAVIAQSTLTCTYTVVGGDTAATLSYSSTTALTAATLTDVYGNAGPVTLPSTTANGLYTAGITVGP